LESRTSTYITVTKVTVWERSFDDDNTKMLRCIVTR
jgi:hypothetical protein